MKILLTHELFLPDFKGGGERIAYELARRLKNMGMEVEVLTTGDPKVKEYLGVSTQRFPVNRYLMNFLAPWIWKHAKGCDLIQTLNYNAALPSLIAGKLRKKPVVCLVTGLFGDKWVDMRGPVLGRISKAIESFQLNRGYDRFIFLSDFSMELGQKIGIPKEKSTVISPGIDIEKFKPKKKEDYVLFMGRLAKQKGVYDLIDAAKLMPDVKFRLVGKGEEEGELRRLAPANVEFLDLSFKDGQPFLDQYAHAPIMVLPSYSETFGMVIPEAMASGCAIVSTVPLDYKGFTIEPGDIKGMVAAIRKLVENKDLAAGMGMDNVRLAQKYTWDNFMRGIAGVYEELLGALG
jgi:glycosyltransferase involved in cell wall biosynthesis